MAIDFMKEHLRKMLTDLDQDLEIPHWPSASPVEHKQTTGFLLKLRNVCVFVWFLLFVLELFYRTRRLPETMSEWGPSTSHRMSGSDSIGAIPLQNA